MSSTAAIDLERGERLQRLPLSRTMHALLGCVMRAIDRRFNDLNGAALDAAGYEPETCDTCGGTGYLLVPSVNIIGRDGDENDGDEDEDEVPVTSPAAVPVTVSAGVQTSAGNPALHPTGALAPATLAPNIVAAGATLPAVPVIPVVPNVPNASASTSAQGTFVPTSAVPAPSVPIAGYTPLGPDYPAPPPHLAVFAGPGAEGYYVVTRGLRVGVFATWQTTSPYVTSVSGAVYSRFSTVYSAYEAYQRAYHEGAVSYL